MVSEFIHSVIWQPVLFVGLFFTNTLTMYFVANLILDLANEKASLKQKLLFSFLIGTIFQTALPLIINAVANMLFISINEYAFAIFYYSIMGYLYYRIGARVLKLSLIRSIKLMGYFYMYYIFMLNLQRLLSAVWQIKDTSVFYFWSTIRQGIYLAIIILIYCGVKFVSRKMKPAIRLADKVFVNVKKERVIYMIKLICLYAFITLLPLHMGETAMSYMTVTIFLTLFFVLNIFYDLNEAQKAETENKDVHIHTLSSGINEVLGVQHDLNNILQTYNGYLGLGDLNGLKRYHASVIDLAGKSTNKVNLSQRMEENPALISLLESKLNYAEQLKVVMTISLLCKLDKLYIDNLDICRCIACLLDNAIEAATLSKQKKVFFNLETKPGKSKLLIITNSATGGVNMAKIMNAGFTSKSGHRGLGLPNVKKILESYGNCTFNMTYYNCELTAYIELREN